MTFTISPAIKQCWPETALGLLLYQVQVAPSSPSCWPSSTRPWPAWPSSIPWTPSPKHPHIAATRQAYKALGASPTNTGTRRRPCSGGW